MVFFNYLVPEGMFDFNPNVTPSNIAVFVVAGSQSTRAFTNLSIFTQDWLYAAHYQIQVGDKAYYVSDIPIIDSGDPVFLNPTPEPEPPMPEPEPEPEPPMPEPEPIMRQPQRDWITQSLGVFELKDDRLTGEILYIISTKFDPFWYGRNLLSIVQIKDPNGTPLVLKENNLAFTETERDERISIDESAFGNTELSVQAFVWNDLTQHFSEVKEFTIKSGDPPTVPTPTPTKPSLNFIQALPFIGIGALFLHEGLKNKRVGRK